MTEQKKGQLPALEAREFPIAYVNHANVTVSFNDFRIYLSEASPRSITPGTSEMPAEALITPRISLVMSPEFGKALYEALKTSVDRYEVQFGQLRKIPDDETAKTKKQ